MADTRRYKIRLLGSRLVEIEGGIVVEGPVNATNRDIVDAVRESDLSTATWAGGYFPDFESVVPMSFEPTRARLSE